MQPKRHYGFRSGLASWLCEATHPACESNSESHFPTHRGRQAPAADIDLHRQSIHHANEASSIWFRMTIAWYRFERSFDTREIHQIDRSGHICTPGRPNYRTQCVNRGQTLLPHIWRYARQPVAAGNRRHFVQVPLRPNPLATRCKHSRPSWHLLLQCCQCRNRKSPQYSGGNRACLNGPTAIWRDAGSGNTLNLDGSICQLSSLTIS
jgi:hypothetical protein